MEQRVRPSPQPPAGSSQCYGFGEQHPSLGFKVQSVLHDLRLVTEAVLPGFNRYLGAEAIGATSALYVCRPTRRSRPAAAGPPRSEWRIYTQGRSAQEARPAALPGATVATVRAELAAADRPPTLVGDGFEELDDLPGQPARVGLGAFLHDLYGGAGPSGGGPMAVNLHPDLGGYLVRLLLVAANERLVLVAPDEAVRAAGLLDPDAGAGLLVAAAWRLRVLARSGGRPTVLAADRAEPLGQPLGQVLRHLVDHRLATLEGAWREGLIACMARLGVRVTKNQARRAIQARTFGRWHGPSFLPELPADALAELPAEVVRTLAALGALGDPSLGDPSLGDPSLGDPSLGDPSLGDPSQGDPSQGGAPPGGAATGPGDPASA